MPTDLDAPKTLEKKQSGSKTIIITPTTRISDAIGTQNRVQRLAEADDKRNRRRALVKGLVDGNPPYRASDLKAAGRSHQCNVNWRTAESYLDQAKGAFYDIFSESPSYATITCAEDVEGRYSRIITEEFHVLLEQDDDWDYHIQLSQEEMILIGCGPIWFNDADDWRTEASLAGELLVPERTRSNTSKWEEAARIVSYQPSELYRRIMHEAEASKIGWNVDAVKQAIVDAHPKSRESHTEGTRWEWAQQQLKNQAHFYDGEASTIEAYHYFVREFPAREDPEGGITHVIGLRAPAEQGNSYKYLFKHERRFQNWRQLVHPMYYATERGGFHHSVTGMGVKMYAAMEYENRLLCNIADKTFQPDVLFRPMTGAGNQAFSITRYGEYGAVSANYDTVQIPQMRKIDDNLAFRREVQNTVASNLSQYRQELQKPEGNPKTATQIMNEASHQAKLGKTQLNRYYRQLDWLLAEKYRRAAKPGLNPNMPGAKQALAFQERCLKRGVPSRALRNVLSVKATRITGQGSEFMRQQNLQFLLGLVAMLPEQGRENLMQDVIAAQAGQVMVKRYYPSSAAQQSQNTDHHAMAALQVAAMKEGVAPVVTGTQNSVIYAQVFLQAAGEAAAGAAQGAVDTSEALAFIELAGPAIGQHLAKLQADPSRKQVFDKLNESFKQLAKLQEQLQQRYEQQQQQNQKAMAQRQRAMAIQQGTDPDTLVRVAESKQKIDMQWEKTRQSLAQKEQKSRQALMLKDAATAQQIRINEEKAEQQRAGQE